MYCFIPAIEYKQTFSLQVTVLELPYLNLSIITLYTNRTEDSRFNEDITGKKTIIGTDKLKSIISFDCPVFTQRRVRRLMKMIAEAIHKAL